MKTTKNELHHLMVEQLRDILWAEKELIKGLQKMSQAAECTDLQKAFAAHKVETEGQVERLKKIFSHLGLAARSKKCDAMAGLIKEANGLEDDFEKSEALDAALIAAAQKIEHYEIASYGTLRAFAKRLGYKEVADLLTETLNEEGAADKKLTKIAESEVNETASAGV